MKQLNPNFGGELGVESENLYRERHLVGDSLPGTVSAGKELQVADVVVLPVAVNVVDGFLAKQFPTDVLGHDVAVFHHGSAFESIIGKSWDGNPNVAVSLEVSSVISISKAFLSACHLVRNFARLAAEFLLMVDVSFRFSPLVVLFPALRADEFGAFGGGVSSADRRARDRAVSGGFSVLTCVKTHICGFVGKRSVADFTRELHERLLGNRAPVDGFKCRHAVFAAVPAPTFFGFVGEEFSAVFARLFNGHCMADSCSFATGGTVVTE